MANNPRPLPIPLPLSSLLAHQQGSPTDALSSSLAILGPLPPTTPIHLALNYLYLSDLPDFGSGSLPSAPRRTLIITTSKADYYAAVREDDEDHTRDRGGDYTVLERLRRVDVRYCPTIKHVMLLLSLLTATGREAGAQNVPSPPGLIILWSLGSLLMETVEPDENTAETPAEPTTGHIERQKRFRRETVISDYLDILSAAQATTSHFSTLDTTLPPSSLIVLEPDFSPDCSLPIFPPGKSNETVPKSSREKRIAVRAGIERLLGPDCYGSITPALVDDQGSALYSLSLARYPGESYSMRRKRCPRADWASAVSPAGDSDGAGQVVEGDLGGWRWEWT